MNCVISGSFRKFYSEITAIITDFERLGVEVLSPKKSKIINPEEEFVILETDKTDDVYTLEKQHLEFIRKSDFLYVCNPKGYTGKSTLLEIGFALAEGKDIHCMEKPDDLVIASFVTTIGSPKEVVSLYERN